MLMRLLFHFLDPVEKEIKKVNLILKKFFLNRAVQILNGTTPPDDFSVFGDFVAAELRVMKQDEFFVYQTKETIKKYSVKQWQIT